MSPTTLRSAAALGGLAVFLVAGLWTARTSNTGPLARDLAASILIAWAFTLAAWGLARRLVANPDRAFLLAVLALCWLTLAGTAGHLATQVFAPRRVDGQAIAIGWTAGMAALGTAVVMAKGSAERVVDILRSAALVLVLLTVGRVGLVLGGQRASAANAAWTDTRSAERPDIYLIVLDKRSSAGWIRAAYGYDQRAFNDSLAALGFKVPAAYANYAHTQLSLPSILAGRLLQDDSTMAETPVGNLTRLVGESPLWQDLRARGYRIAFFPSTYVATRTLPAADLIFEYAGDRQRPLAESLLWHSPMGLTPSLRCVVVQCPTPVIAPYSIESARNLEWKLETLPTLADSAGPIFAFLHLLSPHEPYLYTNDCSHRDPWWPLSDVTASQADSIRRAYATQTRCLDSLVLATVSAIQRRSKRPPIIVITGDHGHGRINIDAVRGLNLELEQLHPEQLAERLRVFTAVKLPSGRDTVPDALSLVELLPLVRRAAWGDSVALQRDAPTYWSPFQRLKGFVPIPRERLFEPAQ